jgi:uroporphyrinogen-III synthase
MTDRRLLITRPPPAARRFLAACEARVGPIPAILSPVMAIRPVPVALTERPATLILTSENGAAQAGDPTLRGLPAWCVGSRTAAAAQAQGLEAIEVGPDAEALLAALLAMRPPGPLLHLRGEHARGGLAARLREAGFEAREVVAYRQEALPPTPEARVALDGSGMVVAPLFSPRSAVLLAGWTPRAPLRVVALSEAVAEAARALRPVALTVATSPDEGAMVEATLAALASLDAPDAAT